MDKINSFICYADEEVKTADTVRAWRGHKVNGKYEET